VAWAVGAIVGLVVILPFGAWLMTHKMANRPPDLRYDERVRAWLSHEYSLNSDQQESVRRAVEYGRQVGDPALEGAAHGLAEQIASRRLPGPRLLRLRGWLLLGVGLAITGGFIALVVWNPNGGGVGGGGGSRGGGPLLLGPLLVIYSVGGLILGPRHRRRAAARALKLNKAALEES
jgi:hypothetical protein